MIKWFKVYQWIKYPIFFGFSIFMLIVFLDNQFYNFIHSKVILAEGMAEILFALLMTILFAVSVAFFTTEIIDRRKRQKLEKVE